MNSEKQMPFNPNAAYRYDPERGFVEIQAAQTIPCPLPFSAPLQENTFAYGTAPVFAPHYDHLLLHSKIQETMPQIDRLQSQISELARMQKELAEKLGNSGMKTENDGQNKANTENTEQNGGKNGGDEDDSRKHTEKKGLSQEKIQEIYEALSEAYNGKPDPNKFMQIFQGISHDFWKGLALGSGAVLLLNCTPLKTMLGSVFGSLLGSAAETADGTDAEPNQEQSAEPAEETEISQEN